MSEKIVKCMIPIHVEDLIYVMLIVTFLRKWRKWLPHLTTVHLDFADRWSVLIRVEDHVRTKCFQGEEQIND